MSVIPIRVHVMKILLILCLVVAFIAAQTQPHNEPMSPVTHVPAKLPQKHNEIFIPDEVISSLLPVSTIIKKYRKPGSGDQDDDEKKQREDRVDGIPNDVTLNAA